MSESCLPSSPPLMLPSASSSQPTTSPLSSSPLGFSRNVREESTENIEDSRDDEGDEIDAEETNGITENSSDEEVDEEDHDISTTVSRSFPASSAHEQMIRSSTPVVCQRQHPMPTSPTSLDPATASRSFPAIPTHEQIRAYTPRDGQTHGPMPTFSTPVGPHTHGAMPTASTPSLESLMHYIDCRIGEHETYMKSMLANHKAAIAQKMEENNKAIMKKIESAMTMNKEACSGGVNVEFEQELSRGVETKYSGGDNFECQQHPSQDERIRDCGKYGHDGVVGMQADANIENVKNHEGRPERQRKRASILPSPYVVQ